ncbi:MAG: MG2 domain-containing protein, partial [Thermoanaerobaculia bacterium]|nr:MG2 domain-containing protein [Thermoanaerobaculia bacterium]
MTIEPAQPGAFGWLDARTLQFRPAEPWPALTRFRVTPLGGKAGTLATLLEAPVSTVPNDGAEGLEPFDEITLTFGEPLPPAMLAKMVTLELRPLPGVSGGRRLPPEEIRIKALERTSRADAPSYSLSLAHPVPAGTRAVLTLQLSADEAAAGAAKELSFATGEPFRVLAFGCRERQLPVTPSGTLYEKDQAIRCGTESPAILVEFSSAPRAISPVEARNLVRFTPSVEGLKLQTSARTLEIRGAFRRDTLYSVSILPAKLTDQRGRPLEAAGRSEAFVVFPQRASYVKWGAGQGVVERLGAQMVPVDGRGAEKLDLRIQRIDPLDRSFWPFPDRPIVTDESERPPGPGEEPPAWSAPEQNIAPQGIARHVKLLGSPPVSAIVELPLKRDGNAAAFGLDLEPHLAKIAGKGEPGTYLVGLRALEGGSLRSWMRIQATDLALATLEEPQAVRFTVTSLATGLPVPGATVRLEGTHRMPGKSVWETFVEGTTGPDGTFRWDAPGRPNVHESRSTRRISVTKGKDLLVLDTAHPPESYADNQWSKSRDHWLDWAFQPLEARGARAETLCHLFTERPVYRPEEEVHLKGYLRERVRGMLHPLAAEDGTIVVEGPGELAWRLPVPVSEAGSFYHLFKEKNLPTGVYNAHFEDKKKRRFGHVSFRMEAYRIPEFEVDLHGPDQTALDKEFQVSLTASYYAGGKGGSRPVQWRVTQFPYDWTPPEREGFRFSSDGRFSRAERFRSSPRLTKDDTTNDSGGATLKLNPAIEPTAQPRTYVVEATVTGADDQTVTSTRRIAALPAFVLGLDVARFVEHARTLSPRVIAVGPDG